MPVLPSDLSGLKRRSEGKVNRVGRAYREVDNWRQLAATEPRRPGYPGYQNPRIGIALIVLTRYHFEPASMCDELANCVDANQTNRVHHEPRASKECQPEESNYASITF